MTALSVTRTTRGAIVSACTGIFPPPSEELMSLPEEEARKRPIKILGHLSKILPVPQYHAVVACTGPVDLLMAFYCNLASGPATLDGLFYASPERLKALAEIVSPGQPYIVIIAGFDPSTKSGFGFSFDGSIPPLISPARIPIGHHQVSPRACEEDDPEQFQEILEIWKATFRAAHTDEPQHDEIRRLHSALFRHQQRRSFAGKLPPGIAVVGDLIHAEVTAGGIHFTTAPKGDEMQHSRAAL